MKLEDFLEHKELSISEFARMIESSKSSVSRWISGERLPRKEAIEKLEAATGYRVTLRDWIGNDE